MIKAHVLQVNAKLPEEATRFPRYVAAGRTRNGHWQSVKNAGTGDIAVRYEAGSQVYTARGWVSGPPIHIGGSEPFGPYRSPVPGLQWPPTQIDPETVREASGFDGGHQCHCLLSRQPRYGARDFCAIRSYLSTAARHGLTLLDALIKLTGGNPSMPAAA